MIVWHSLVMASAWAGATLEKKMGTRCLTRVNDSEGRKLLNLYRQFDGYLDGAGKDLFEFIKDKKIVNGYTNRYSETEANGAGCLAAQIVAHFKKEIGGFYIYPVDSTDCGQEYEYVLTVTEANSWVNPPISGGISVEVIAYGERKFAGTVAEFGAFIDAGEAEEE